MFMEAGGHRRSYFERLSTMRLHRLPGRCKRTSQVPPGNVQEVKNLSEKCKHQTSIKWKRKWRDESDESEDTERGEMDDDINQNINGVDDKDVIGILVDQCLVFYQQIQKKETVFYIDSLRSAW